MSVAWMRLIAGRVVFLISADERDGAESVAAIAGKSAIKSE
jgi:hypothetical protein